MLNAAFRFDLVQVRADHLPAKDWAFLEHGVQHARHGDVDAVHRLAGDDRGIGAACSMRTSFQSTSSSSAMSIGSIVLMPWPISGFLAMIVTMPVGAMRMKALGTKSAAPPATPSGLASAAAPANGSW